MGKVLKEEEMSTGVNCGKQECYFFSEVAGMETGKGTTYAKIFK